MLIAPYYKDDYKIGTLSSTSGTIKNKTVKEVKNTDLYKNIINDRSFYAKVSELEVTYNIETKSYQLYAPKSTDKVGFQHLHSGDGGVTIKCHLISFDSDKTNGTKDITWLKKYFTEQNSVNVITNTEAIPNGIYDISNFEGFKLLRKGVYEFDIEFTTYTNTSYKMVNKKSVLQTEFIQKCPNRPSKSNRKTYTAKQIKEGKAKKNTCIEYVNKILYKLGYYKKGKKDAKQYYKPYHRYRTNYTNKALISFAKKWNKKGLSPKVNEKGKMSKNMWTALKNYHKIVK